MQTLYSISCLFLSVTVFMQIAQAQLTFSEVMYDVSTNEYHDEFVEIFNTSYKDSLDITGWTFSDSSGIDKILSHRGGNKIGPRQYALILDGSYFGNSLTYDSLFTDSLLVLKIGDNSFGKNGLSNSIAEWLTISDSLNYIQAEYRYSIGNKPGYSDEKINLDNKNDSLNWSESKIEGGTPGYKNSVAPPRFDFGFNRQSFIFPHILIANAPVVFSLELLEFGLMSISDSIEIVVFDDLDIDLTYQSGDLLIARKKVPTNEQMLVFNWNNPTAGEHLIVAQLCYVKDENPGNNTISKMIRILEQEISLHINEIYFLSRKDETEWIELYNFGSESILLKDWAVTDLSDTARVDSNCSIDPGGFCVLCEDTLPEFYQLKTEKMIILSNFPILNDQEDEILLLDPSGKWVEKVRYNRQWLVGEDFMFPSLERIHPLLYENKAENWGPCINSNSGTPGEKNSIFSELNRPISEFRAYPNPFSPNGDGYDDVTIISGQIPDRSAKIKAEIYDIRGRMIRVLKDNAFSGRYFNLVWDGKDNNGRIARIGVYIIYLQVLNDREGTLSEMKTTVILAQRL